MYNYIEQKKRIYKEMIKNIYTKQNRQIWAGGGGREKIPVALLQCSEKCKRFNKTFDLEYLCKNH